MIHCYQCISFTYQGQSPNATNESVGVCEEYAGTKYYVQFYGSIEACHKFKPGEGKNRCPTCHRAMPRPEGA